MIHRSICVRSRRSGFVLVIVLSILVLVAGLVITFLMRVGTERSTSASYSAAVSARQIADTAVGLVQGQINLATSQGPNVAWTSQPGMVRTFDTTGKMVTAYKLYSASDMVSGTTGIGNGASSDEPPGTWASDLAVWTDLNAPVQLQSGDKIFPILDPSTTAEGFSVNSAPGATTYQPAPMPVRWLYLLEDGALVAPTGTGKTATIPGATASNKIVGRVAFWTDDDTCKVNINTASVGTFWDMPRAYSKLPGTTGIPTPGNLNLEQGYGYYQPVQKEFQRYPGHPAMTDLRAVFGAALTTDQIFNLVPRVIGGGSTQGTVHAATDAVLAGYPKEDRLYAGIDELIFNPGRETATGLDRQQLEQAKFFLTSHSRAPETNLFNLPRVACWPIHADLASNPTSLYTTAFDRLIALCASTGAPGSNKPYYFQRQDALSPTNDISIPRNGQVYDYLKYLTSQLIPGFGGNSFATKYGADRDQILTETFDYIRSTNLYDTTLPAGGGQFTSEAKGTVVPTVKGTGESATMGFGRYYTLSELGLGFICNADGNYPASNAIADDKSQGIKANMVLGGVALAPNEKYIQAIVIPEFFSVMCGFISMMPDMKIKITGLDGLSVNGQPLFPPDSATPVTYAKQYPTIFPYAGATKYGANPGWRYFAMGAQANGRAKASPARGNLPADGSIPASDDAYSLIGTPIKITDTGEGMEFSGGTIHFEILAPDDSVVQTITIKLPAATFPTPKIVDQGITNSQAGTAATTQEAWWSYSKTGLFSAASGRISGRLAYIGLNPGTMNNPSAPDHVYSGVFFRTGYDVLRTVLPKHGDFRLVAGRHEVPDTVFQPHRYYFDTSVMMASNLTNSISTYYDPGFDMGGKYISSLTYPKSRIPDISSDATGTDTPEITGDYDDPLPDIFPGPFVNKPNEGSGVDIGKSKSIPYYYNPSLTTANGQDEPDGGAFFSPNRMMPSPGMFGSLPTGVFAGHPWQTLLFRPQPTHPGVASPEDHLYLDLFWMPVVEPYAISDRFSTAGKINLNYQILPFTYLKRSTGLRALFKSEKVTAMPNNQLSVYKSTSGTKVSLRKDIDADETLSQFETRFDHGEVFKAASEICDIDIVPVGQTVAGMAQFWKDNALTGDNVREAIYTNLYPRLTTKSNTFTVHFLAQSLKKVPGGDWGTWTEGKDVIVGEYRGSTSIERFIDANNGDIPDYAANAEQIPALDTLDKFYKWRVIANRQFSP